MRDNWKIVELWDVGQIVTGKTPKTKVTENYGGKIPFITPKDMNSRRLISNTVKNLTGQGLQTVENAKIPAGTIIVSCIGSDMGKVALTGKACVTNQQINSIIPNANICGKYIYYNLLPRKNEIRAMAAGSAQPILNKSHFSKLKLNLPPLSEQKTIARILGSLDDKIELNRQMNRTLEHMAQAIFKAWFVDFEPFKDGKFVDSELGMIPDGWKVGTVSSIIEINPKLPLKKGVIAQYVDMKGIPTSGPSVISKIYKEFNGGSKFQNKDILLARITPCLENGKTALVDFLSENEIGFGSTEFIVLREKGSVKSEFIYCLARNENFRKHCIASMVGSSGRQRVQLDCFDYYRIAIPINALIEEFHRMTKPYFEIITQNQKEIESLIQTRDTLLPKLVSGEIGV